ncbi:8927_t:CDS:2 [Ambispora gerdemannii]|uniref:8927_t:CDS:1 n=1 Tax=Ambispora gerdemannii TaxID=144530 RepID=A0A9N8YPE2_9GLOM|nr:8927_t:CDS:2 [Ambispora gerdemannii]
MRSIAPSKKGYIMPEIKVRFPPEITPINLIEKAIAKLETSGQTSRIPNAFIAYRMAFCKELHLIKHPVITQPQLSALVKQSWLKEGERVRREYQRIAKEAKDLYIQICHERSPLFVTSEYQNNSGALEFVFSNSSNLSGSNFDLFDSNEISLLPSEQPVTKDQRSDSYETISASTTPTPNVKNIFKIDSPENDNCFSLDFNLDTHFINNMTPELLTSQSLFSSILSIQSDFPSAPTFDNSNSNESSIASDSNVSSTEYDKYCKEKIGVLENRVVELEKKLESLTNKRAITSPSQVARFTRKSSGT